MTDHAVSVDGPAHDEDWRDRLRAAAAHLRAQAASPIADLEAEQAHLSGSVVLAPWRGGTLIAGVDTHFLANGSARAAAVLLDGSSARVLETATAEGPPGIDYRFGLLGYRELPLVCTALSRLSRRPDLVLYDGNGVLHPRRLGAASHLGVLTGLATIGVSKNVKAWSPFPEVRRGDIRRIEDGLAALVVTRDGTKPVCVSPGHLTDLTCATREVLQRSRSRIPEPIRLADRAARSCLPAASLSAGCLAKRPSSARGMASSPASSPWR